MLRSHCLQNPPCGLSLVPVHARQQFEHPVPRPRFHNAGERRNHSLHLNHHLVFPTLWNPPQMHAGREPFPLDENSRHPGQPRAQLVANSRDLPGQRNCAFFDKVDPRTIYLQPVVARA